MPASGPAKSCPDVSVNAPEEPVLGSASESLESSVPWLLGLKTKPAGDTNRTEYVPGGTLLKTYCPEELVVVVAITVLPWRSSTVTPPE